MIKNITCIICPKGCSLTAEINEGIVCVNGNTCERGKQYATDECLNPTRTVTSMVRVSNKCNCMVFEHSVALPFFGIEMKIDIFQSLAHS